MTVQLVSEVLLHIVIHPLITIYIVLSSTNVVITGLEPTYTSLCQASSSVSCSVSIATVLVTTSVSLGKQPIVSVIFLLLTCKYFTDTKISNCETDRLGLVTAGLEGMSQYSI